MINFYKPKCSNQKIEHNMEIYKYLWIIDDTCGNRTDKIVMIWWHPHIFDLFLILVWMATKFKLNHRVDWFLIWIEFREFYPALNYANKFWILGSVHLRVRKKLNVFRAVEKLFGKFWFFFFDQGFFTFKCSHIQCFLSYQEYFLVLDSFRKNWSGKIKIEFKMSENFSHYLQKNHSYQNYLIWKHLNWK